MSGHSDLEFLIICEHLPLSPGYKPILRLLPCPAHPGSIDITSITFAAVICDADDPCSVNTAEDPESSFTMSPRSTDSAFVLLVLYLQFSIL